jgi:hypothetical protein
MAQRAAPNGAPASHAARHIAQPAGNDVEHGASNYT